jgi:zinc transporter ZupT
MVLSSKGVSARRAMIWSVITSLPQPLVAVPAYMFAETFTKFLPLCMGFAAGCMIWMVFAELLPDSLEVGLSSRVMTWSSFYLFCLPLASARSCFLLFACLLHPLVH